MMDVSVIIAARNEEFLQQTIDSVLSAAQADTEVIAILDGYWPEPGIQDNPKVQLVHHNESIGQRAAVNEGVRLSQAKYIMKLDAHCIMSEGFDVELMQNCEYDWTVIPRMDNVDAFHWVCKVCGHEMQQGPLPESCSSDGCGGVTFDRKLIWQARGKKIDYMWFDTDLRMKYFDGNGLRPYGNDLKALKARYSHKVREWAKEDITDVMNGIGACFFMHRERYWDLGGMDEGHGSWGQMAVEVACKAWLSGGRHVVNKRVWFAHLARTQKGFGFPYPMSGGAVEKARQHSQAVWMNDAWPKATRSLSWLIDKFAPVPGWDTKTSDATRGIVYYTDNQCEERLAHIVRHQLKKVCNGHDVVSVSHYPLKLGRNIVTPEPRGVLTMFRQILAGLEESAAEVVFFCEHDVIYHPSHFDFYPARADVYYYNVNTWKLDVKTGQALHYITKQVSGLCAYRALLIEHYRKRIAKVEADGFTRGMGFEPGCHAPPRGVDTYKAESWMSEYPNVDVRHANNLTANRFKKEQFRSEKSIVGWTLADEIPGWGKTKGCVDSFLREIV